MKKLFYRLVAFVLTIMLLTSALSISAFADTAQSKNVRISIPKFNVEVDNMAVDSQYMEYPLIVYNDITYFPLTWNWCRRMGLVNSYTQKDGLYIAKYYVDYDIDKVDNGGYQKAGSTYNATIVDYPVFINGVQIDNAKEKYPLLNFRNVTYFPLTWRFVVDEFAWDLTWDNEKGLKIMLSKDYENLEPGTYERTRDYLKTNYYDYAIINSSVDYTVVREDGSTKDGVHGFKSKDTLYKLNYADDSFTKLDSDDVDDTPYNSGIIKGENVKELFTNDGSKLLYNGKFLYDITADAGKGNTIDGSYVSKHKVNNLDVYLARVYTTQQGKQVPAPYTPHYYYVFVDRGDGNLQRINEWNTKYLCNKVCDDGNGGFYLSSPHCAIRNTHISIKPALLYRVSKDLKVEILNKKWKDWKNLELIGSDKEHNLYLMNTWFTKESYDAHFETIAEKDLNLVSPINDGIFKLTPKGEISKLYSFVNISDYSSFVSPNGTVYVKINDKEGFFNIQTKKWLKIKQDN